VAPVVNVARSIKVRTPPAGSVLDVTMSDKGIVDACVEEESDKSLRLLAKRPSVAVLNSCTVGSNVDCSKSMFGSSTDHSAMPVVEKEIVTVPSRRSLFAALYLPVTLSTSTLTIGSAMSSTVTVTMLCEDRMDEISVAVTVKTDVVEAEDASAYTLKTGELMDELSICKLQVELIVGKVCMHDQAKLRPASIPFTPNLSWS